MLTAVIQDEDLLKQAVVCYFDPATQENAAVRQALSYFLPVYCHSKRENMERMAFVAPAVLHTLLNLGEELDEEAEMVGITVVGTMLVDWTDARKLVVQDAAQVSWDEAGKKEVKAVNGDIHLDLAEALLERAMSNGCTSTSSPYFRKMNRLLMLFIEEEKKALISILSKLYITANSDPTKLQTALDLAAEAMDLKIASDAPSRNALNKLHTTLSKAVGENGKVGKGGEGTTVMETRQEEVTVADEGLTVVEEEGAEVGDVDEGEETKMQGVEEEEMQGVEGEEPKMQGVKEEGGTEVGDSLLEELLDDEEEL